MGRLWVLLRQVWSFEDNPGRSVVTGDDIPDRWATDGGGREGMAFAAEHTNLLGAPMPDRYASRRSTEAVAELDEIPD